MDANERESKTVAFPRVHSRSRKARIRSAHPAGAAVHALGFDFAEVHENGPQLLL